VFISFILSLCMDGGGEKKHGSLRVVGKRAGGDTKKEWNGHSLPVTKVSRSDWRS